MAASVRHSESNTERDEGVDRGTPSLEEVAFDGWPGVKPAGECGQHAETTSFQTGDDAIVMRGVAGEQVGAHHQQTHRTWVSVARGSSSTRVAMRVASLG